MKIRILILLIIISTSSLYSQVPGYMGKRIGISYSGLGFASLLHMSDSPEPSYFNYTHSLNIEWAIKKNKSIGIRLQSFSMKAVTNAYSTDLVSDPSDFDYYGSSVNSQYTINGVSLVFDYIVYKDGWIAPLGRYRKFSLIYTQFYSTDYLKNDDEVLNVVDKVYDYNFALTYTMGKKWIFYDLITLNLGSQIGVYVPNMFRLNGSDSDFSIVSNKRISTAILYNIELGVGIVL